MSEISYFIFIIQCAIVYSTTSTIPICKVTNSTCLKSAAQMGAPLLADGMPDVGTERLDVMHLDLMKFNLAGLNLKISDADVQGLKKAHINKVNVDKAKKQMNLGWDTDILLKGQYKASGRMLILPISGDGDLTIKLKKLRIDMTIPYDVTKNADGKDMVDLKSYKCDFDVKDNARFELTNLFNGNKVLSDAMLHFMNENWKILSQEFGGPLLEIPNQKVYDAIRTYLMSKPLENFVEY